MSDHPRATIAIIERTMILVLVGLLLYGVFEVVRPFITAILFGAIVAVAAWPARAGLMRAGVPRGATAALLLAASLALVVVPALILAPGLANQVARGSSRITAFLLTIPRNPPTWLADLPLVGGSLGTMWYNVASGEMSLISVLAPYSESLRHTLVVVASGLADSLLQLLLALGVATFFWVNGEDLASDLRDILYRLGGETAANAVDIAGLSVRGIAYGVVGTAVFQAILMGIGLSLAGIKSATAFAFMTLLLALSQIGLPLVYAIDLGSAWWCFVDGSPGWGIFLIAWCAPLSLADNVLRPWLISFGMGMPLGLVVLGVFGGFVSFGFLGLFIGPSLLAVAFTLLANWRGRD
jgi:predicted PurR-regulated permease PerM